MGGVIAGSRAVLLARDGDLLGQAQSVVPAQAVRLVRVLHVSDKLDYRSSHDFAMTIEGTDLGPEVVHRTAN